MKLIIDKSKICENTLFTKEQPQYFISDVTFLYEGIDDDITMWTDIVKAWAENSGEKYKDGKDKYSYLSEPELSEEKTPFMRLDLSDIKALHGYLGGVIKAIEYDIEANKAARL